MKLDDSVTEAVRAALPKGSPFKVAFQPMRFSKTNIVRVVTPAWKTLRRSERALRMQKALDDRLSPAQQKKIFRVSVLTPDEFKELQPYLPARSRLRYANGAH